MLQDQVFQTENLGGYWCNSYVEYKKVNLDNIKGIFLQKDFGQNIIGYNTETVSCFNHLASKVKSLCKESSDESRQKYR